VRSNEQFGQEPQIAADPAKGGSDNLAVAFGNPKASGVVIQREYLEGGRANRCHRTETVAFGQIVDAPDDKFLRLLKLFAPRRSEHDRHRKAPSTKLNSDPLGKSRDSQRSALCRSSIVESGRLPCQTKSAGLAWTCQLLEGVMALPSMLDEILLPQCLARSI
jgi:hypothetical protein